MISSKKFSTTSAELWPALRALIALWKRVTHS
jgi:hypothetical protein